MAKKPIKKSRYDEVCDFSNRYLKDALAAGYASKTFTVHEILVGMSTAVAVAFKYFAERHRYPEAALKQLVDIGNATAIFGNKAIEEVRQSAKKNAEVKAKPKAKVKTKRNR